MKVIDLLNKIAKGKIPKTIVYDKRYFTYDEKRQNYFSYDDSEIDWKYTVMEYINDEVEIIEDTPISKLYVNNELQYDLTPKEDKKIDKLDLQYKDISKGIKFEEQILMYCDNLQYKINEIIDRLNGE